MKITRLTDRMSIKVGEVTFVIAPVSFLVKKEIADCTRVVAGEQQFDLGKAQIIYIKHALKELHGVEDNDGNPYKLSFDGDILSDDCVSELMYLENKESFMTACWKLLNEFNEKHEIEGVKLSFQKATSK